MVPFSILYSYYFVTKELAASLAVEGKARGVDVHAVHPSPAACSAMSASCVPLTCHGPSWACLSCKSLGGQMGPGQFFGRASRLFDAQ